MAFELIITEFQRSILQRVCKFASENHFTADPETMEELELFQGMLAAEALLKVDCGINDFTA